MKDRSPFGLAGLWENWKDPATGDWVRTFCVITTTANDLVSRIHDRMPAILRPRITRVGLAGKNRTPPKNPVVTGGRGLVRLR